MTQYAKVYAVTLNPDFVSIYGDQGFYKPTSRGELGYMGLETARSLDPKDVLVAIDHTPLEIESILARPVEEKSSKRKNSSKRKLKEESESEISEE